MIFLLCSEEAGTEDQGNFGDAFVRQLQNYIAPILFIGLLLSSLSPGSTEQREVSFSSCFSNFLSSTWKNTIKASKFVNFSFYSDKLSRVQEQAIGTWLG